MRKGTFALLVALSLAVAAQVAHQGQAFAQRGKKAVAGAKAKGPSAMSSQRAHAIEAQLSSSEPATLQQGIAELRTAGTEASALAPAAEKLLAKGLPDALSRSLIEALAKVGQPSSSSVIAPYLHHRNPELRRAAAAALAKTKGADASSALVRGLSDSDPMVRGSCASGLGALGAKDKLPELFIALDHKISEAAASIGMLCDAERCEKFVGKMGQIGFDVMTSGFEQILFRNPAEMSDDQKIKIIGNIRELGTSEANAFLKDVQGRWPATWSKKVKLTIDQAVSATEGAVGSPKESK
jgi:HEAT repeat protein